jgi:alpha-mannosidase
VKKELHMIGNAHLDPVWLWQWQEGFQEVKSTFRSALDRMEEYEDLLFTSSSAAFYERVEKSDPGMFREIKARVAEGRWGIVGGWWIQPDCNIPGGESFVRQALYGQRYFREKFGATARVGYNVDSFGHNGALPQILAKSGLDFYVFMRPEPHEKGLPSDLFWWESDDGSRVLAFRISFGYCTTGEDLEKHVSRCADGIKEPFDRTMCFYGVGNHGGGPTRENIESILRLNADPKSPELIFDTPDGFFERASASGMPFPTVHDELQHHAVGCYSAHSGVKRLNRRAENALNFAEKFCSVVRQVTGQEYPEDFDLAWKAVLFNQFHDILAGTSLEAAYEDARDGFGEAMSIAGRNLNYAIQSISWSIGIEQDGTTPIVVFNPHSWPSLACVESEFGNLTGEEVLLDDEDRPVPLQTVRSHASSRGRNRICFVAHLPAMGYRVYRIASRPSNEENNPLQAGESSVENDRFRLGVDTETGFVSSLYDKQKQIEVFAGPAARPVVLEDRSDTWSHGVVRFDDEVGVFSVERTGLVEHGPVKAVLRVESSYGSSRLRQDFTVYAALDRIDVEVTVDWREQFKALKLRFPVNLDYVRATCEIPYGSIEREADGAEQPGQGWIDLSGIAPKTGETYGLSILNDGKYGLDVRDGEVGLTVLRSPIYAHHDPFVPQPDESYSFVDQGIQRFTYALLPHAGGWEAAGTVRHAAEINERPVALIESYHEGPLPQKDSYLSIQPENVILEVLKQAEDGDDLIVRCRETSKQATRATIHLPRWEREIEADFAASEIKTFRVPADENLPVVETNLLEREEPEQ